MFFVLQNLGSFFGKNQQLFVSIDPYFQKQKQTFKKKQRVKKKKMTPMLTHNKKHKYKHNKCKKWRAKHVLAHHIDTNIVPLTMRIVCM